MPEEQASYLRQELGNFSESQRQQWLDRINTGHTFDPDAPPAGTFDPTEPRYHTFDPDRPPDFQTQRLEDPHSSSNTEGSGGQPPAPPNGSLDEGLQSYFRQRGEPMPPMHVTSRENLNEIVNSKMLEAPSRGGASWNYNGTARNGDVAIRLAPGAEQYVELAPSTESFGQVPRYYPDGVGSPKSYVPTDYLEYFNVRAGQWLPLKR